MVNRNLLSSKLAELADRVNRLRSLGALSLDELTANRDAFDLASFNLMFSWLAVLGVPEPAQRFPSPYDVRFGVLQTKFVKGPLTTEWPGVWYSTPMVGATPTTAPSVLLTAHNNSGPCREDAPEQPHKDGGAFAQI